MIIDGREIDFLCGSALCGNSFAVRCLSFSARFKVMISARIYFLWPEPYWQTGNLDFHLLRLDH
jgi:hypothetical protein